MTPVKSLLCAGAVVFVAGFGLGFFGWNRVREAEDDREAAVADAARWRQEVSQWEQRALAAETRAALAEARLRFPAANNVVPSQSPSQPAERAESERPTDRPSTRPGEGSNEDVLVAHPEVVRARVNQYRATLRLNYGPIYRKLGLSTDQMNALEQVMATSYEENMEARAAALANGLSPSDPSLAALSKSITSASGRRMAEIVGRDKAAEFFAAIKSEPVRAKAVDPLAGSLYYTDAPLTLVQAEQLTRIVVANTSDHIQSGLVYSPRRTNWDAVMTQAATVLTPTQLSALQALRELERSNKELTDVSTRVLREAKAKKG